MTAEDARTPRASPDPEDRTPAPAPPRVVVTRGIVPAAKLDALKAGAPDLPPPGRTRVIETRTSFVVLHEQRALKIKKPLRTPLLDFSTPALRRHDADEELRLNRRLAPGVYLGVRALQRRGARWRLLQADEAPLEGPPVDWVVEMERLPQALMLDEVLARGDPAGRRLDRLADTLCEFYRHAPAVTLPAETWLARLADEHRANVALLSRPALASTAMSELLARHGEALVQLREPLADRARGGHLLEGHGDLRPEHVCLRDPPVVIDCLAWNATLREVDPFDEIMALGMECAAAGDPTVSDSLWALCERGLGGAPSTAVRAFYVSRRALLRARQSLAHLLDSPVRTPGRWRPMARRYLREAEDALDLLRSEARRRARLRA